MATGRTRRRGRAGTILPAIMCVLVALPASSVPEPSGPETAPVPKSPRGHYVGYVGTFNIYGNVGHRGDTGDWIKDEADAIKELTSGDSTRWLFIGLQEVCKAQGERFARELGMNSAFVDTGTDCADGQPFGNSVLFHSTAKVLPPTLLPNPDNARDERGIICALVRAAGGRGPQVTACSTHLSVGGKANRAAQAEFIHHGWQPDGSHPLGTNGPVIVAGDLNALPDARELDGMYGSGVEASGPRETESPYTHPTYDDGRKIDYLFTWGTRGSASWRDTGIRRTDNSDHNFYYSGFSMVAGSGARGFSVR
ncbi:endonuclease/exonuclease/phosphatase family protein [Streptomyces sp. 2A115]|uniref:endonuclease/exonuclease/phosphatase family protein n=1 Tax=Streptomyces sp. 2A115 TaxID=3457439 RepID=UPI003FD00AEE